MIAKMIMGTEGRMMMPRPAEVSTQRIVLGVSLLEQHREHDGAYGNDGLGDDPDIAAKMTQRRWSNPQSAECLTHDGACQARKRSAMVPWVMMLPARTKKGIASSSSFFTASYMSFATT